MYRHRVGTVPWDIALKFNLVVIYKMGKIYNIVLNSTQGTVNTDTRSVTYYFDWSRLPQKRYKLSFVFQTALFTSTNVNLCNIYADLGQTNNFLAGTDSGGFNYLGTARFSGTGANSWLYSDENFSPTHHLEGPPSSNQFTVSLLNNNLGRTAFTATTYPSNYTLILSFEEVDE
jgi:hypothetical protein